MSSAVFLKLLHNPGNIRKGQMIRNNLGVGMPPFLNLLSKAMTYDRDPLKLNRPFICQWSSFDKKIEEHPILPRVVQRASLFYL